MVLSCCVDVVAGEHYNADCLVHFGHSCLSLVDKLPVHYVFEKFPLDLKSIGNEIKALGLTSKTIILYDCGYSYLYGEF